MYKMANKRPSRVEINLDNLAYNFHSLKSFIESDIKYMAVVKANAYGHGSIECSKRLESENIDWFGVALPEEGYELRSNGIKKPILCFGGFWEGQEHMLIKYNLVPVIYQIEKAHKLNELAHKKGLHFPIHIKVDTGMGRIGIRFDQFENFINSFMNFSNLKIEGIMTHFANADDLNENEFTDLQIKRFNQTVSLVENNGFYPKYKDLANSPGAIAHENSRGNMVRLGGVLYGLGDDVLPKEIEKPDLKPVMSIRSVIAHLKTVPSGETLGYSRTFRTKRNSVIATIPLGYHDGINRLLSNKGKVIVGNKFAPIVGRISMDWTIVDVTDIPNVNVNDEVTFIGEQNGLTISAEDIAKEIDTISYEVTCGINSRVARKYK